MVTEHMVNVLEMLRVDLPLLKKSVDFSYKSGLRHGR